METIKLTKTFKVKPAVIYSAWLSSKTHTGMTGGIAKVNSKLNGKFSAWDEYITGKTIELKENKRIVQHWRTTEFPADAPDSILEIKLLATQKGTKLIMSHKNIPAGQSAGYKKGWKDFYFKPMQEYFKLKNLQP
jgi:activator of HSP90 ATPase